MGSSLLVVEVDQSLHLRLDMLGQRIRRFVGVLVLGDRGMELAYEENGERGSRSHGIRQELKGVELAADELECVVVNSPPRVPRPPR